MRFIGKFDIEWREDLVKQVITQAAKDINKQAAFYCARKAMEYAPVDTGLLRSSIHVMPAPGSLNDAHWQVIVDAPYAVWVELGHTTASGSFVSPNPFLRFALEDTRAAYQSIAYSGNTFGKGFNGPSSVEGPLVTTFTAQAE